MKSISIPAYNRPTYLKQTLDSLERAELGDYEVFVALEHGAHDEVIKLCTEIDWAAGLHIIQANKKQGCDQNTFNAIKFAFDSGSEFNIYWEDDIEASSGLCALAKWYEEFDDRTYMSLHPESYTGRESPTNELRAFRAFSSHGFMCNKYQYEKHYRPEWLNHSRSSETYKGWDWNLGNYVKQTPGLKILCPMHAYARHIGQVGTYCSPKSFRESGQADLVLCHDRHESYYVNTSWYDPAHA